jgi:polyhydroxyalkanoate synthesis repressor PhaR
MAKSSGDATGKRATGNKATIKKYANRRLYDTESSAYITLDRLAAMIREGREFEVVDAKTGEDITRHVLTQIIVDEEARGSTMLPVNFLRQLIGLYGNSMQGMVPQYLEAAMEAFERNQTVMRDAFGGNVLADLAKKNMALFGEASRTLTGKAKAAEDKKMRDDEVEQLRAELAALQAKVDRLGH